MEEERVFQRMKKKQFTPLDLIILHLAISLVYIFFAWLFTKVSLMWPIFVLALASQSLGSLVAYYFMNQKSYDAVAFDRFLAILVVSSLIALVVGVGFSFLLFV